MRNPEYEELCRQLLELHDKKNEDYSGGKGTYFNFEFAAKFASGFADPIDSVFATLLGVKYARLIVLMQGNKKPNNESVEDTRLDIANYTNIWTAYKLREKLLLERKVPVPMDVAIQHGYDPLKNPIAALSSQHVKDHVTLDVSDMSDLVARNFATVVHGTFDSATKTIVCIRSELPPRMKFGEYELKEWKNPGNIPTSFPVSNTLD